MGWQKLVGPLCRFLLWWLLFTNDHRLALQVMLPAEDPFGGRWELLLENTGVSAMHMTLTHQNTVIVFDKTDIGASQLLLPDGRCRQDTRDTVLKEDCWAHAVEYNLISNQIRALEMQTDPWCSSGSFLANGTLLQTGGWNDGARTARYLNPCRKYGSLPTCDWIEIRNALQDDRWYATNQVLPDNRVIVVGGRRVNSYEFIPARTANEGAYKLPLLEHTYEEGAENNLYPFVHLSSDDTLFIFANRDSILLNHKTNEVLKQFPRMPGNGSRSYPSSGTSVIFPLLASDGFQRVEVMVCGGSAAQAFQEARNHHFRTALDTCGRLVITDDNPMWSMETMPTPRVMSDMIILPTGDFLLVNGALRGTAGWGCARDPVLSPYIYQPGILAGFHGPDTRWQVLAASPIPRMYHSSAVLIADGRILVGGSNTNRYYNFTDVLYPTELRMEAFSPYYLDKSLDYLRPTVTSFGWSDAVITYGSNFDIAFDVSTKLTGMLEVRIYAPAFSTHSLSMNQRQLVLQVEFFEEIQQDFTPGLQRLGGSYRASIRAPPTPVAAPAGYYLMFVLNSRVPSRGKWIQLIES